MKRCLRYISPEKLPIFDVQCSTNISAESQHPKIKLIQWIPVYSNHFYAAENDKNQPIVRDNDEN